MVRAFFSALLTLLAIHSTASAGQRICPAINFGPYGPDTYMYYAILHDDNDANCNFGTPVMYIGGPGEEAYCVVGGGSGGCITLGGPKAYSSTKRAVKQAVVRSDNKCFTKIPQVAPDKIDFSAPFLPDHAFDQDDPQFAGHAIIPLGSASTLTRQGKPKLQHRLSWQFGMRNAVLDTAKTTLVLKNINSGTDTVTQHDVGLGVECNATATGLTALSPKSVTLAVGFRENSSGKLESFLLRSGNQLDGVLMVVSDSGGIYFVRVKDTAAWGHP